MKKRKRTAKGLVSIFVCMCMVITMIPQGAFAAPTNDNVNNDQVSMKTLGYKVDAKTTSNLNVRKEPTSNSTKLGTLPAGSKIVIKGFKKPNSDYWYEITMKGKRAYVHSDYVNVYKNTYRSNKRGVTKAVITAYNPGLNSMIKESFTVPKNTKYQPLNRIATNNGYIYRIRYNGKIGYIKNKNINTDPILSTMDFPTGVKVQLKNSVSLYKGPSTSGGIMNTAPNGTVLVLTQLDNKYYDQWYKTTYKGNTRYLKKGAVDLYSYRYRARQGKTTGETVAFRASNNRIVESYTIPSGKWFDLIGRISTVEGNVYHVSYNGREGFVKGTHVDTNPVHERYTYPDRLNVTLREKVDFYNGTKNCKIVNHGNKGDKIQILEKIRRDVATWYKVIFEGKTLYCKVKDVNIRSKDEKYGTRYTTASFSIHKEVSDDSSVVVKIPKSKKIELIGEVDTTAGDYLEIQYNNYRGYAKKSRVEDWISTEYIKESYDYNTTVYGKTKALTELYEESSTKSHIIYKMPSNHDINVTGYIEKNTGTWYEVKYNGKTCFAKASDVKLYSVRYKTVTGTYTTSTLNLRAAIGTKAPVKYQIPERGFVQVKEKYNTASGNWFKVTCGGYNGFGEHTGFVKGSYLKYINGNFPDMGIDVSKYNTRIDWDKVADSGVDFVFIRLGHSWGSNGDHNEDPYFRSHIEGAISAGLDIGVYYFSQAVNKTEARREVDFLKKTLKPYEEHINLPIVIDSEYISSDRPGRADHLSKSKRTEVTIAFCERVKASGFEPMIYMSKSWITNNLNYDEIKEYPFWIAQYNICNQTPQDHEYWQYTSDGYVPGISGRVDMNIKMH